MKPWLDLKKLKIKLVQKITIQNYLKPVTWLLKTFFQSDFLKLPKVASLRVGSGKLFHNLHVVTVKVLPF